MHTCALVPSLTHEQLHSLPCHHRLLSVGVGAAASPRVSARDNGHLKELHQQAHSTMAHALEPAGYLEAGTSVLIIRLPELMLCHSVDCHVTTPRRHRGELVVVAAPVECSRAPLCSFERMRARRPCPSHHGGHPHYGGPSKLANLFAACREGALPAFQTAIPRSRSTS